MYLVCVGIYIVFLLPVLSIQDTSRIGGLSPVAPCCLQYLPPIYLLCMSPLIFTNIYQYLPPIYLLCMSPPTFTTNHIYLWCSSQSSKRQKNGRSTNICRHCSRKSKAGSSKKAKVNQRFFYENYCTDQWKARGCCRLRPMLAVLVCSLVSPPGSPLLSNFLYSRTIPVSKFVDAGTIPSSNCYLIRKLKPLYSLEWCVPPC